MPFFQGSSVLLPSPPCTSHRPAPLRPSARGRRRTGHRQERRALPKYRSRPLDALGPLADCRRTVDVVHAVAHRLSEPCRLVGLSNKTTGTQQLNLEAPEKNRLDGFCNAEVLKLYKKAFPANHKDARSHLTRSRADLMIAWLTNSSPPASSSWPSSLHRSLRTSADNQNGV